jgi:hypothetical protein
LDEHASQVKYFVALQKKKEKANDAAWEDIRTKMMGVLTRIATIAWWWSAILGLGTSNFSQVPFYNNVKYPDLLGDGDHFGQSVASLGDLDDDGISDIAVGVPGYSQKVNNDRAGAFMILYGAQQLRLRLTDRPLSWNYSQEDELPTSAYSLSDIPTTNGLTSALADSVAAPVACTFARAFHGLTYRAPDLVAHALRLADFGSNTEADPLPDATANKSESVEGANTCANHLPRAVSLADS